MDLPGYDDWKTSNPDDLRCEHCGAGPECLERGWQPDGCNGECGIKWRDPDDERDAKRDDRN
jgi:hypothetical protein